MWPLTVPSLMNSARAIWRFECPWPISRRISISRAVKGSRSGGAAGLVLAGIGQGREQAVDVIRKAARIGAAAPGAIR